MESGIQPIGRTDERHGVLDVAFLAELGQEDSGMASDSRWERLMCRNWFGLRLTTANSQYCSSVSWTTVSSTST